MCLRCARWRCLDWKGECRQQWSCCGPVCRVSRKPRRSGSPLRRQRIWLSVRGSAPVRDGRFSRSKGPQSQLTQNRPCQSLPRKTPVRPKQVAMHLSSIAVLPFAQKTCIWISPAGVTIVVSVPSDERDGVISKGLHARVRRTSGSSHNLTHGIRQSQRSPLLR